RLKNRKDMMMVERIEFMGIPGSGKSTLCNMVFTDIKEYHEVNLYNRVYKKSINKHFKGQGIGFRRYIRILFINRLLRGNYIPVHIYNEIVSKYMLDNYLLYQKLLDSIIQSADSDRRQYILKYLLMDVYKWEVIKSNTTDNSLILMDEGFVHRALNVFMY